VKNPWLSYVLIRLGLFFGVFFTLLLFQFNPFFAAIIAAAISFAIALLFLDRQRDAMSEAVAKKLSRDSAGRYQDDLSSEEDRILDLEAKADNGDAGANQDGKA
jgi:divalent metal cation (Fe/Co/Zn/Cd) transporter